MRERDIDLDPTDTPDTILVTGSKVKVVGGDFMLDSPESRKSPSPPSRRALVHDHNDGLTINCGGDYPGGVTIAGTKPLIVQSDIQFSISHKDDVVPHDGIVSVIHAGGGVVGSAPAETVSLGDVIRSLRRDIKELQSKIK